MVFSVVRFGSAMTSKVVEGPKEGAISSSCRAGKGLMDWVDFILHMAVCLTCMCVIVVHVCAWYPRSPEEAEEGGTS